MPKEKNSASSAIWSATSAAQGDLDHRADQEIDFRAGLGEDLLGHGQCPLLEENQLLDGADQRDHDLGQDGLALLLHLDGGLEDRPDLHVADLGELDGQAAAAQAEHRVSLVEFFNPALDLLDRDAELAHDLALAGLIVRQEFVERGIEQADGDRQAVHRLEDADEVLLLVRLEPGQGLLPPLLVVGEDHLPHVDDSLALEEHVLGAAQSDPLGAERTGLDGVLGRVGVGADLERADLVGPGHELGEMAGDRGIDGRNLADHDIAGRAVDRDEVANFHNAGR